MDTYLCAECQLISQRGHIVLQQVHQALEEGVVLALHVCVPGNTKDMYPYYLHNQANNCKNPALWLPQHSV